MLKKVVKKKKKGTNLEASRRVFAGIEGNDKFWKPKLGQNRIRILPSNREDGSISVKAIQHHGFKVEGNRRAFPCMSTLKKPCPVCRLISHHDSDDDPDVKALLKDIRPVTSFLLNIIDRNEQDGPVRIYSAPITVARELNNFINDDDYGDITDPETGYDLKITRTGATQFDTRYSTRIAKEASEIENFEELKDGFYNLENERYREIPTTKQYLKYIESNFGNVLDVEGALGVKSKDNEEEENEDNESGLEDDEENEEEEDEEEPPAKKKKKLRKKVRTAEDL